MSSLKSIFSPEQDYAFEKFRNGENIFISGAGGSGKSFLIKHFVRHLTLHAPQKKFQVTSTTGCSSVLLCENIQNTREYGKMVSVKTVHSWSGIRLCKGDENKIIHSVLNNRNSIREWKKIKVLIIDEVSMMSCKMFSVLEKIARFSRKNGLPFGGIQVVFLGDMYQLAPVPDSDDPTGDSAKFCFESPAWNDVFHTDNHIELTTIFRQTDDAFKEILGEIRVGKISEKSANILKTYVGRTPDTDTTHIIPPKILSTRAKVEYVNNSQYANITGEEHVFPYKINTDFRAYADSGKAIAAEDIAICSALTAQQVEFEVKNMKGNISPPEELKLKRGCPVMCLVNVNLDMGISNGSLGVVEDFAEPTGHPIVQFKNGMRLMIEPHTWQNPDYPCICIQQYPVCLSFANTIHKLQGATLDMAIMDLGSSIFTEGQTYVALSRVKSLDGLFLQAFRADKIRVHPKVVEFYTRFPLLEFVYEDEMEDAVTKTEVPDENIRVVTW
jgi:ATP-dependent DNA helicase PIF1